MGDIDLNKKIRGFLDSALNRIETKDYSRAIEELKAAEKLDSENPEILYNLGVSYCKMEQYDTSITCLEKLLNLPFSFVDLITVNKLLSYALILSNKIEQAMKYIDDVIKLVPSDTTLLNMLGYCLEKEENYKDAISAYERIIDLDNQNYNAYNSLAYIIAKTGGDLSVALEYAKKTLGTDPENPAYLDTIGYVYLKRGNAELAKKYLKSALSKIPDSDEIKSHINQLLKIGPVNDH